MKESKRSKIEKKVEDHNLVIDKRETYAMKIIKSIGITGQLQSNRSIYYFENIDMFRKGVRNLIDGGYIKEVGCAKGYRCLNVKDLKCLVLDKKGREVLEKYYPDIFEYYRFTTKGRNDTSDLSIEGKRKRINNKIIRALKSAINKLDDQDLIEDYMDDLNYYLYDVVNVSSAKFISTHPEIKDLYECKEYDEAEKRLKRILKLGDVIGFVYKNMVLTTPNEKPVLSGKNKISLNDNKAYFYQHREIKSVIGEKIEYTKLRGVIFSKNKTIILYNVANNNPTWELTNEEKLVNSIKQLRRRKFKDYAEDVVAVFFSRDYENAIDYISSGINERNLISPIEHIYDSIHYIPLFVNDIYSKKRKPPMDYANQTFNILKNNFEKPLIEAVKKFILSKANGLESYTSAYVPADFIVKNDHKADFKDRYYLSYYDSNISKLKVFINYAQTNPDKKFIIYAFHYQKEFLCNLNLPKNTTVNYTIYEELIRSPINVRI